MKSNNYESSPDRRRFSQKNLKPGEPERYLRDGS